MFRLEALKLAKMTISVQQNYLFNPPAKVREPSTAVEILP